MKTCFNPTVESSPCYPHPPISIPTTVPCIPSGTNRKYPSLHPSFDHRQLVQQVVQYMMEHIDQPISINMLCSTLYVSRRTLHNAFREVVGVGPMTYLKTQRMTQVHHQLEQTHPLTSTVFDIAYQWGFYHMGHFSRDYKHMFGESPSDTLRREPT